MQVGHVHALVIEAVGRRTENRQIFIAISDSGCGIPQELREKIYEPFFTTKPIGAGTGLGLSIVYEVVTRHQGSLSVRSEVGYGATFTLSFPFDNRQSLPAEAAANAGDPHGR